MACHEIAGLRIGLMNVIGIKDSAELKHEMAELGDSATKKGPIRELTKAQSLTTLLAHYEKSLVNLEEKIAKIKPSNPKLGYYKTLIITTKKVEMELRNHIETMKSYYRDLEEIHDFIHEVFPD